MLENNTTFNESSIYLNIDVLSIIVSSLVAILVSILFPLILRFTDEWKRKEATLYYPLRISCKEVSEIFSDFDELDSNQIKARFKSFEKTYENIVYNYGSIRYLNKSDLDNFLLMKNKIDKIILQLETRSWDFVSDLLEQVEVNDESLNENPSEEESKIIDELRVIKKVSNKFLEDYSKKVRWKK